MIHREEYDPRSRASRIIALAAHPDWECLKEELIVLAYNQQIGLCTADLSQPVRAAVSQGLIQGLSYVAEGLTRDLRNRLETDEEDEDGGG